MRTTRRAIFGFGAAGAAIAAGAARAQALTATPAEEMGPFYPIVEPDENAADLTGLPGASGRALGTPFTLAGRVRAANGRPVAGAIVLVWHASAGGVYGHPRDIIKAPRDPHFRGHALIRTARDGSFRIASIRPGAYPDAPGTLRTPHVHFEVIGEEGRLVTQMYFPGEPLNARDRLLNAMAGAGHNPRALIAERDGADDRLRWEVVLERA